MSGRAFPGACTGRERPTGGCARKLCVASLAPLPPSGALAFFVLRPPCSPLPVGSDAGLDALKVPAAQPEPHAFIRRLSAAEVRSDWRSPEPGPRAPLLERGEGEEAARVIVRKRVSL